LEISDCCHRNSTSLESLQGPPPQPSARRHVKGNHRISSNPGGPHKGKRNTEPSSGPSTANGGDSSSQKCSAEPEEDSEEGKHWYCDSDCEDCDGDALNGCKSSLVRTIREKRGCDGQCECNSCTTDNEDEDIVDSGGSARHCHDHTPSMASELTLKAVDICESEESASVEAKEEATEEYKLDDHVYGEICEKDVQDRNRIKTEDEESKDGKIEENGKKMMPPPKAKPRLSCMKPAEQMVNGACKCRSRSCNKLTSGNTATKSIKTFIHCKANSSSNVSGDKDLKPKLASLKCLRRGGGKMADSTNEISRKHSSAGNKSESREQLVHIDYSTMSRTGSYASSSAEKILQGRYPNSRTVSNNFDTDSDYVQLPPFYPRVPPKKGAPNLLKCPKRGEDEIPSDQPPTPPSLNTLPRRKSEVSLVASNSTCCAATAVNKGIMKVGQKIRPKKMSKSTDSLNLLGLKRPEPPPKPKCKKDESGVESSMEAATVVDARIISSKPQILVQTAYATHAPVPIPSQAHMLFRGPMFPPNSSLAASYHNMGFGYAPILQHSRSVDNIYDMVASEEPSELGKLQPPPLPPPLYPKSHAAGNAGAPVVIRPNNYIDIHASSVRNKRTNTVAAAPGGGPNSHHYMSVGNKCGSVPNNLNNFLVGLQNLKPLSRVPIVHPGTTSCLSLSSNEKKNGNSNAIHHHGGSSSIGIASSKSSNALHTTPGQQQLSHRNQMQQFKAQLYSDMDYVIFPPKDPRISQQEYIDCKGFNYDDTVDGIPPPYLPPPPPYPAAAKPKLNAGTPSGKGKPPAPPPPMNSSKTLSLPPEYQHMSHQSLYQMGSATSSTYSASQYYAPGLNLNAENLQRFLSTQSLMGSQPTNGTCTPPIYYPSSTQSAPPLPHYKHPGGVIENGMQKAILAGIRGSNCCHESMGSQNKTSRGDGLNASQQENLAAIARLVSEEKLRMMKLCRSEESLCSKPIVEAVNKETEAKLQAIYNLPPPPPYRAERKVSFGFMIFFLVCTVWWDRRTNECFILQEKISPSDLDLTSLRQKCAALELPLLRALCSDGALLTQTKPGSARAQIAAGQHRLNPKLAPTHLSVPKRPPKSVQMQ